MMAHRIWLACSLLVGCMYTDRDQDDRREATREPSPVERPQSQGDFCQDWADAACNAAVVSACQASNANECRHTQTEFCRSLVPGEVAAANSSDCIAAVAAA